MSTQKVPAGGVKTIGSNNLTGGLSSRGTSKEEEERPQMLESKMRNFSPELKKELKQINSKQNLRQR